METILKNVRKFPNQTININYVKSADKVHQQIFTGHESVEQLKAMIVETNRKLDTIVALFYNKTEP